jgi:sulfur relay (sulfurtransferase) DsrC/TusE family protein
MLFVFVRFVITSLTCCGLMDRLSHRSLKENLQKLRSYSQSCLIAREEFEVDVVITVCSRLKSHCNKSIKHYATWSSTLKLSNFPNNKTKFWKFSEIFCFCLTRDFFCRFSICASKRKIIKHMQKKFSTNGQIPAKHFILWLGIKTH